MDKIKIIQGERRELEKQYKEFAEQGFLLLLETHRMIEFGGKIIYSGVMIKKEGND